jgi:hypothetical protein
MKGAHTGFFFAAVTLGGTAHDAVGWVPSKSWLGL